MKQDFRMNSDSPTGSINRVVMQNWNMNRANQKPKHKPANKACREIFEVLKPLIDEKPQSNRLPSELFNDVVLQEIDNE